MNGWRAILLVILGLGTAVAAEPPVPVQMPPRPPSPIEEFRSWLGMAESGQEKVLAEYPEEKRAILREKLKAYEEMPADQRERRLGMLELRWHLRPLMGLPPEQRNTRLEMVPPRLHEVVRARLEQWDRLDAETRREILADDDARELVTAYFVHVRRKSAEGEEWPMDDRKRAEIRAALARLNSSSPARRARMASQLAAFFELRKEDQKRALNQLSESEREEMQRTLNAFARLAPEQRNACVESFYKFASMTPAERAGFLRNAALWDQMTAQERDTWRRLVHKLPPMPVLPPIAPPFPEPRVPAVPVLPKDSVNPG